MAAIFQKIFLIDDDPIYLFVAKKLLKEQKFSEHIQSFENGKLAFDYLLALESKNEEVPSVIFLDLSMPVMNGWEFLDHFKKTTLRHKETIQIIVMSSSINALEIDMIKSYDIVSDYIVKPLTPADLQKIAKR